MTTRNFNIMGITITLSGIMFIVGVMYLLTQIIIPKENEEYRQAAMNCLHSNGSSTTVFENNLTIEYNAAWEISPEELDALNYLSKTYNIILITH